AVEEQRCLQPQRVAGAEAAGRNACIEQRLPERRAEGGIDNEFETVFASVARPRGEQSFAAPTGLTAAPGPQRAHEVASHDSIEAFERRWPLDGDHGGRRMAVDQEGIEQADVLLYPALHLGRVCGIGDDE